MLVLRELHQLASERAYSVPYCLDSMSQNYEQPYYQTLGLHISGKSETTDVAYGGSIRVY